MPAEIYNEGRVVGYSAYEIYVKQHLSEDPDTPVASEREWLASSIAMGSSVLLKLPRMKLANEDTHGYIDIPLPSNSILAAANTIIASFFDGEAAWVSASGVTGTVAPTDGAWATRVTDYGQAISNTSSSSPSGTLSATQHSSIPRQQLKDWTIAQKNALKGYMKIVDGLVLQPGTWKTSSLTPPTKDFSANLKGSSYPTIRLHVKGSIGYDNKGNTTNQPYVLFTGFTIRSVLMGIVGTNSSTNTPSPQNGDFLGPAVFPWANKIVFSVPTSYIVYFAAGAYKRKINPDNPSGLPGDTSVVRVTDEPVIDMRYKSADGSLNEPVLENYYNTSESTDMKFYENTSSASAALTAKRKSRIPDAVSDFTTLGDGTSVLTVYAKKAVYPPALYGTYVDSTGGKFLHPIDSVAPGSVKMFYNDDGTTMQDYQDTFEGTTAINKTSDGTLEVLDPTSTSTNIKKVSVADLEVGYLSNDGDSFKSPRTSMTGTGRPRLLKTKTGKKSGYALMMSTNVPNNSSDPTQVTVSTIPTNGIELNDTNSKDNLSWSEFLDALRNDRYIDILGTRLKDTKYTLKKPVTGRAAEGTTEADRKNVSKGSAYLEFGPDNSAIRLYICKDEPDPTNVPIGSIGIGWGFEYEG